MKNFVYISGKITGLDMDAVRIKFERAEQLLRQKGFNHIINPIKVDHSKNLTDSWVEYMKADIKAMMCCSTLLLLPCWNESTGAELERDIATRLRFEILTLNSLNDMPDMILPKPQFPADRYENGVHG